MGILNVTEAILMAQDLPFFLAAPIYGMAWAAFIWILAKAIRALRDAFKG